MKISIVNDPIVWVENAWMTPTGVSPIDFPDSPLATWVEGHMSDLNKLAQQCKRGLVSNWHFQLQSDVIILSPKRH